MDHGINYLLKIRLLILDYFIGGYITRAYLTISILIKVEFIHRIVYICDGRYDLHLLPVLLLGSLFGLFCMIKIYQHEHIQHYARTDDKYVGYGQTVYKELY